MSDTENLEIKAEISIDDAGTVTGLAWPFGAPDSVGDVIEKGAFGYANTMPMLMEHEQGKGAIGVWESFAETDKGLEVKGRLFLEGVKPARDAHRALKLGTITGLSIGFRHNGFEERPEGGRVFKSITVNEISLCRRPVHPGARVTVVKSVIEELKMHTEEMKNEPETKSDPVVSAEEFKAVKARLDAVEAKSNRLRGANNNQPAGENENGEEKKAFFDFLRTGRREEKALTTSTGGVLIPDEFRATIIQRLMQFSPVRSVANVTRMNGSLLEWPRLVNDVTVGEVTETSARPESEPTFDSIDLKPFEMSVIVPVSRTMLEDSVVNLEGFLRDYLAKRYGQKEGAWFINGNGTTQAEGILTSADVAAGVTTASTTAITADELIDLFYSLSTPYASSGVWMMNLATMARIRKLKDADGSYLWQQSLAAGQPPTLLGRPIIEAKDMPNVAAGATPILFGDFASGYTIADRVDFEFDTDYKVGYGNGLVKILTRRRVGGRVVLGEALTKLKMKAA
ncbi:phage major capsid protein [Rhizobium sp. FKL33]|uniref:phage major capsid protein n=1 Tax=Rhizobium sp. FKL33 TaxID=2562307 RepID=UPI0010C0BB11|nr:phage major capsid protein [Rhizobium sp. FKL33]